MRRTVFLIGLAVIFLNVELSGQTQPSGWTFADFKFAIAQAGPFPSGSPEAILLAAISKDLDALKARYTDLDTEQGISKYYEQEFSTSMASNEFAISHLPSNLREILPILKDIDADLHIKTASLQKLGSSMAITDTKVPSTVAVQITVPIPTVSGVKSSDLSVRANPHYLGTKSPCIYILANGAGSFRGKLPPGRFWVWVETNGIVTSKMEVDIGLSATNPQPISFE